MFCTICNIKRDCTLICTLLTGHPVRRVLLLRYSYEFKMKCVEMYKKGEYPDTPEGIETCNFHITIRRWVRIVDSCGPEALRHKSHNKVWTAEGRYELVARVIAGESIQAVAYSVGISHGQLYNWVCKYKTLGYNGLKEYKKGRPTENPKMKKNPKFSKYRGIRARGTDPLKSGKRVLKSRKCSNKKRNRLEGKNQAAQLKAKSADCQRTPQRRISIKTSS